MMRSKAALYAALSVIEIARREPGQGVRAREIAELFDLPPAYAAKVMTQLTRAGILASDRGPRGGYRLARDAAEVTFLEVVEAVDGIIGTQGLPPASGNGDSAHRGMLLLFDRAVGRLRESLGSASVADYVDGDEARVSHAQRPGEPPLRVPAATPTTGRPPSSHRIALTS